VDEHVLAAVIANDKAETLLAIEEFYNALGGAEDNARAHVTRGARATEATAAGAAAKATAAAAAAEATATAAAAAAKAITAAAATVATAAETITAAATTVATTAAAFKLVETALALVETTTTPGTTSASIKAHFLSKSSIVSTIWCPSAAMR
jgi:hypothetical protein